MIVCIESCVIILFWVRKVLIMKRSIRSNLILILGKHICIDPERLL